MADQLVDNLISRARIDGADSVRLDLLVQNNPARRLYTKHGFVSHGVIDLQYEHEEPLASELMELML